MDSEKQKNLQYAMNWLGLTVQDFGLSDISQIGVIPNLADEIIGQANGTDTYSVLSKAYDENEPNLINKTEAVKIVKDIINNPVPFEQKVLQHQAESFGYHKRNFGSKHDSVLLPALQETINFLASKGVPANEITNTVNTKYSVGYSQSNTATHVISDALGSTIMAATLAFVAPQLGAEYAASLGVDAAVGNALASVSIQTAQGVDFETAVTNATVNAVVSTQSPTIANDIAKTVGSPGVADAITSGGASIFSTLAKGGSTEDALKNAGAAIVASGVSGQTDRTVGAAVGGAITGGVSGAAIGAAGELGRPTGGSSSSTTSPSGSVDTTGAEEVSGDVVVTAPRETTIGDTNIQIPESVSNAPEVVITAPRAPTGIGDTNIQVSDTVSKTPPATRTEDTVEITAPRIPTNIAETDIQNIDIVGKRETDEEFISEEQPEEPPTKPPLYKPSLFVYSGKYPSASGGTLSRALNTDLQASGGVSSPTTGLTSYRAAGEIEGQEGINRKNVWNEESLRLKDALGL